MKPARWQSIGSAFTSTNLDAPDRAMKPQYRPAGEWIPRIIHPDMRMKPQCSWRRRTVMIGFDLPSVDIEITMFEVGFS